MRILLISATAFEVGPVQEYIQLNGLQQVRLLIAGVGLLPTVYALTKAIHEAKPDLVIQAGIAGSLDHALNLGDVVLVKEDRPGDTGVVEKGKFQSLFDLKLQENNQFPWQDGGLPSIPPSSLPVKLPWVKAVTVSEISTRPEQISYYQKQIGAQVESMEGAALHFVCLQENIPFIQIRSISNKVGDRDKTQWKIKEAINELNKVLCLLLDKFNES